MKKRFSLFLMAFVAMGMLMTSCTKDNAELILGTWTMDLQKSYDYELDNGVEETHYISDDAPEGASLTLTFNADGTVKMVEFMAGEPTMEDTMDYLVAEDKLSLMGEVFTIEKLTKKALVIEFSEAEEDYEYKLHWEFTR